MILVSTLAILRFLKLLSWFWKNNYENDISRSQFESEKPATYDQMTKPKGGKKQDSWAKEDKNVYHAKDKN